MTQMINFNQGMVLPGSNHFLMGKCFEQTKNSVGVICSISRVRVRDWLCMEPSNCGHQCWRLCSGKLHDRKIAVLSFCNVQKNGK